jgi:hypothetical protein
MKPEDLVVGKVYIEEGYVTEYTYKGTYTVPHRLEYRFTYIFGSHEYSLDLTAAEISHFIPKPKAANVAAGQVLTSTRSGPYYASSANDIAATKELYNEIYSKDWGLYKPNKCGCGSNSGRHSHWCPRDNA